MMCATPSEKDRLRTSLLCILLMVSELCWVGMRDPLATQAFWPRKTPDSCPRPSGLQARGFRTADAYSTNTFQPKTSSSSPRWMPLMKL